MASIVSYVGVSASGRCGYCKSTKRAKAKIAASSNSVTTKEYDQLSASADPEEEKDNDDDDEEENSVVFGLLAHCLCLDLFNQLLDMGWSRSGRYLYKPLMERTCCPQYTIRLDVHKFRLSRTQKRVLKTMYNFLKFDQKPEVKGIVKEESGRYAPKRKMQTAENVRKNEIGEIKRNDKTADGMEMKQPKKKELRRKRAEERLKMRGIDLEQFKRERAEREQARMRTLHSYLGEYLDPAKCKDWKHRLELRIVGQPSAELDADIEEEFQLFKRYQIQIHNDDRDELSQHSFTRFLASSPLTIGPDQQDDEHPPAAPSPRLGSFHQQYRLDGRLIAVGVIDILPRCLSAKYFFYDPDHSFLSMGTYSALREIAFTQQLALARPELHFYYMGFYLFDCPKMRYKGRFRPSELLCDNCYDWVPLDECERLIEQNGGQFTTFHPDSESSNPPARPSIDCDEQQIGRVRCIYSHGEVTNFGQLRQTLDGDESNRLEQKIRNFVHYTGPDASSEIILAL